MCVGNPNDLNVLLGRLVEGSGLGLRGVDVGKKVEAESDLGDQVSNGNDANLLREAERTGALGANDPHDGVHEPHQDGEPGEALEGITAIALSVVEALEEEHEDDDQEDQGGNPPHVLVGSDGEGADETADYVQHHVANEGDDGGGVRAGEEGKVRKDELFPTERHPYQLLLHLYQYVASHVLHHMLYLHHTIIISVISQYFIINLSSISQYFI